MFLGMLHTFGDFAKDLVELSDIMYGEGTT